MPREKWSTRAEIKYVYKLLNPKRIVALPLPPRDSYKNLTGVLSEIDTNPWKVQNCHFVGVAWIHFHAKIYLFFHKTKISDLYKFKIHKLERCLDCYRGSNFRFKHLTRHENTGFNPKKSPSFLYGTQKFPCPPAPLSSGFNRFYGNLSFYQCF